MGRLITLAVATLPVACATSPDPEPAPVAAAPDVRPQVDHSVSASA
jgi:hypothetical protein